MLFSSGFIHDRVNFSHYLFYFIPSLKYTRLSSSAFSVSRNRCEFGIYLILLLIINRALDINRGSETPRDPRCFPRRCEVAHAFPSFSILARVTHVVVTRQSTTPAEVKKKGQSQGVLLLCATPSCVSPALLAAYCTVYRGLERRSIS